LREAVGYEDRYEFLTHDRDRIFASYLDEPIRSLGVRVLKSPPRCQMANTILHLEYLLAPACT
jgi:putative transposase